MKKILTIFFALTVLVAACACTATVTMDSDDVLRVSKSISFSANAEEVVEAKDIKLEKNHMEMKIGAKATLKATILPSNADDRTIIWKSGNDSVLTVSQEGEITAVAEGSTTVEAKIANGQRSVCQVNVVRDITDDGLEMKKSGYIYYEDFALRKDVPTYLIKDVPGKGRAVIEEGALRITVVRGGDDAFLTYEFDEPLQSGKYTVEARVRADSIEFANPLFFYCETSDFYDTGKIVTQVAMEDNYFKNNTGSGWKESNGAYITPYDVGKWYDLRMMIDMDTNTYDFYVDGKLEGESLKFRKTDSPIKYLRFGSENDWADLSIAYIKISETA